MRSLHAFVEDLSFHPVVEIGMKDTPVCVFGGYGFPNDFVGDLTVTIKTWIPAKSMWE